jgi:hypothetical protein
MLDLLYLSGTFAFFALMLAYVAGCQRLGASADVAASRDEARP